MVTKPTSDRTNPLNSCDRFQIVPVLVRQASQKIKMSLKFHDLSLNQQKQTIRDLYGWLASTLTF